MMLARQVLGDERAGLRELYEAVRFLVDRAILIGTEATERRLTVVPNAGREGWVEVRAKATDVPGAPGDLWVSIAEMDELALTFDAFAESVPADLEEAVERSLEKPAA